MNVDSKIQQTWLRLLDADWKAGEIQAEKLDEGYYAVVVSALPEQEPGEMYGRSDYQALESLIPNLSRTRAVYLQPGNTYHLPDVEPLQEWAGNLAARVEGAALRAFAVVDLMAFVERLKKSFAGWSVKWQDHDLWVADGRFKARLNLLLSIVRMVLSRSGVAEAIRALREEAAAQFVLDRKLFEHFEGKFGKFGPAVLDHYFTANPQASCVAAGWDYWQVAGKPLAEAEEIFEEAMREFETLLETPSEAGLAWFGADACKGTLTEN